MTQHRYNRFSRLQRNFIQGRHYRIETRTGDGRYLIMAPHGGRIEPGTAALADAIAGKGHGFYAFSGMMASGNRRLHIASTRFDEPRAIAMINRAQVVVTVHGCRTGNEVVYVGGRHAELAGFLIRTLSQAGIAAVRSPLPALAGRHPNNLCNRGRSGKGVQLELAQGLRKRMFRCPNERRADCRTAVFDRFVAVVRKCLETR